MPLSDEMFAKLRSSFEDPLTRDQEVILARIRRNSTDATCDALLGIWATVEEIDPTDEQIDALIRGVHRVMDAAAEAAWEAQSLHEAEIPVNRTGENVDEWEPHRRRVNALSAYLKTYSRLKRKFINVNPRIDSSVVPGIHQPGAQ